MTKKKEKKEKKQKVDLKQQRDRLNVAIEAFSENLGIDNIAGALAQTEIMQGLIWYLISSSNTKTGNAMTSANKLILAGSLIPTVDLPKGAVLGALLEQGDDIIKTVEEAVEDIAEKAEVFTGKWWNTQMTRGQCRNYDSIVWESEGKPMYSTTGEEGKNMMPLYTSFVSEPHLYKGNDDCEKMGIPAVCVLKNEQTGNKKVVAQICDNGNIGV